MWEAGICGPQEIVFRNFKRLESKGGYDKRIYIYIQVPKAVVHGVASLRPAGKNKSVLIESCVKLPGMYFTN